MKATLTLLVIFTVLGAPILNAVLVAGCLGRIVESALNAIYPCYTTLITEK